ncbi:hypothetical protein Glove_328g52 [Diversispora epigaea]|uniref:Uncharacterized protein n=1 Tax=Diversispora epigaea TaxID=1348612 RepID=A0A397HKV4_9GLOM|nr:hypothetical protein Glove_328g52 [Diversispora epigaea]
MLNKDEFTIQHYTKETSSQSLGNSVLEKCTGCAQGDRNLVTNFKNQDVCLIKMSMAKSVSINVVRSVVSLRSTPDRSNRLQLRSSQNAIRDGIGKIIEDSLPVGSIRSIDPPTIYISNNAHDRTTMFVKFQNFWIQENIQTKLDDIRLKLSTSVNFFKRKPSKSFTLITFEYLQHKHNIYEGYWYRKPSFLLIKCNTPEVIDIDNLQ